MQQSITLDDVIASEKKYGCVLTYNAKKARDLKSLNAKSKYDTTYIPLLFKHINGKEMPVKIKFSEQLIGSSAKVPQGNDEDGVPKHLNISFMKLDKESIEGGDYVPKVKDTPEAQEKENLRVTENIERYVSNNEKFVKVLDIIDASYKTLCNDIKEKDSKSEFAFRTKKDRNQKEIPVFSIKQITRNNRETNTDEALPNPIYRLKVPVCRKDGRIGVWSNYANTFKPIVFDARKMTKKNNYQPVPATVNVNGVIRDLNVTNAGSFIVYKSLVGGNITFECITASKFGLSLNNSFYDLYVYKHKSRSTNTASIREDIIRMRGGEEEEEDAEEEIEIKQEEIESKHNNSDDEPEDSDDEPEPEPEHEPEPEPEPEPESEPEPEEEAPAPKKVARKKVVKK
jgi:hypothetical protein